MNKYKQLTKKTGKTAAVAFAIVAATGAIFGAVSMYAASVEETKKEVESKLNDDKSKMASYSSQMDQSGEAEKRFAIIQETRASNNYSGSKEELKEWWNNARTRYQFDVNTKLLAPSDTQSDKETLKNLPYNIVVLPRTKVGIDATTPFGALSDVHIFSFIDDLRKSAPGIARIELIEVKRKNPQGDLDVGAINQIRVGVTPLLVDARIEFSWIGITPKEKDPSAPPTPPAP